ncbi:MAG: C39 family peptidase [Candidatus Riflebacteria bacterium]|nr:C39 family peptidase [Candidatus Riflebacteria bacterium]
MARAWRKRNKMKVFSPDLKTLYLRNVHNWFIKLAMVHVVFSLLWFCPVQGEESTNSELLETLNNHQVIETSQQTSTSPSVTPTVALSQQTSTSTPTPSNSSTFAFSSKNSIVPQQEYGVVTGDCLYEIARKLLGDGSRYPEIVELNKAKYPSIAKNPDLIFPGWVFQIPKTPVTTTVVNSIPTNSATKTDISTSSSVSTNTNKASNTSTSQNTKTSNTTSNSPSVSNPVKGIVHVNPSLNIRNGPWGQVIGSFCDGAEVQIIGKDGDWYKISWNGTPAYCYSDYISIGGTTPTGNTSGKIATSDGGAKLNVPKLNQMTVNCPAPGSACGPSSLAMAISFYNGQDPSKMASQLWNICGSTSDEGTPHDGLVKGAQNYGFPNAKWYYDVGLTWIKEQISAGKPIVANVTNHYLVIKGFDTSGNLILNDPYFNGVERVMSFDEFSGWWNGGGCYHSAMLLK